MSKESSKYYFCRFCDSILEEGKSLFYKVIDKRNGKSFFSCDFCKRDMDKLAKEEISREELNNLISKRRREALLERNKMIMEAEMKWKEERKKIIDKNYRDWYSQYLVENGFKWVKEKVDYSLNCRICQTDIKKTGHYLARKQGIEEMNEKFGTVKFELISSYCYPCLEKVIFSAFEKAGEDGLFIESYEEFKEIVDEEKNKADKS